MKARPRIPPENGSVKAVSPRHCAAMSALGPAPLPSSRFLDLLISPGTMLCDNFRLDSPYQYFCLVFYFARLRGDDNHGSLEFSWYK